MTARITRIEIETEEYDGLTVKVTVSRIPSGFIVPNNPRPDDVPPDIRDALRDWLGTEPTR